MPLDKKPKAKTKTKTKQTNKNQKQQQHHSLLDQGRPDQILGSLFLGLVKLELQFRIILTTISSAFAKVFVRMYCTGVVVGSPLLGFDLAVSKLEGLLSALFSVLAFFVVSGFEVFGFVLADSGLEISLPASAEFDKEIKETELASLK